MSYIKKYVKKGIKIQCANCSKTVYVWPSYLKLKRGKYCSTKCCGNHRKKPKRDTKIYVTKNEDSALTDFDETSLFKNYKKEREREDQSYPIILNPVPFNWLYNLRMNEIESKK